MTNAVLYGAGDVEVSMNRDEATVRMEVSDGGSATGPVRPRSGPPDLTGGRGLRIVDRLVDRWGVDRGPEGTTVWVQRSIEHR